MISKTMKAILHALSYGNIELESSRRMADLKQLDAMRIFVKKLDARVYNGEHEVPVRLYFPTEEAMQAGIVEGNTFPILLFFHGGGWVTESVENYDRVCARMAQATAHIVVSVEYRLAPEHKFPVPLEDCYAAAKALYTNQLILNDHRGQCRRKSDSSSMSDGKRQRRVYTTPSDTDLSCTWKLLYRGISLQIRAGERQ